jgi:hypothetical protein
LGELDERQQRYLSAVTRGQRRLFVLGALVTALGAAYALWGLSQFDPRADPLVDEPFDRPVARAGEIMRGYRTGVDAILPSTKLEAFLLRELSAQTNVTGQSIVVLLRFFLGAFLATAGLVLMTVGVERGRLLALIRTLRE